MRPWDIVDHEALPYDDGTITLMSRGSEFVIQVDGRELMGNRHHGSEDALAELACDRIPDPHRARVLVGGLGMGFTLAAALRRVGPEARVTVAELMPAVVRWNREHVGRAAGHPLRDPRATVHVGDVCDLIEPAGERWSAILLDVDNGPSELTRPANAWLYGREGLQRAHQALVPGGVLGIWSVSPDPELTRRLRASRFEVERIRHLEPGRPTRDGRGIHTLWMARR